MRFIISIFLLLSTNAALCCCNSYSIGMYPFKKEITENSVFIIEYNTDLYKFNIEKLRFKAKTLNGKLLDLKIKKKYSVGSEAQIILSCSENFTLNDSISIQVEKEKIIIQIQQTY